MVIGILAAITVTSYTGITAKANVASIVSDLANARKKIDVYHAQYGVYPTDIDSNNCLTNGTVAFDQTYCLRPSAGTKFVMTAGSPSSYGLSAIKGSTVYQVSNGTPPKVASTATNCPTGFVLVPGDATYGTGNFCVMKYEAKNAGSNVPTSTPTGTLLSNVSQYQAADYSTKVAGCSGCHLISEAEWMTIARNALRVTSNWSGGAVGSGYIFQGNTDGDPAAAQPADAVDTNYYIGTNDAAGDAVAVNGVVGNSQRRTLTLTNGSIVWDISGNLPEWTSGQTANGRVSQPGVTGGGLAVREYNLPLTYLGALQINIMPAGTGISGSSSWSSARGIGTINSNADSTVLNAFRRGKVASGSAINSGILSVESIVPTTSSGMGFRVTAPAF